MARKPNYQMERHERARLKALKNEQKAAAKKEARERAKQEGGATGPTDVEPSEST